MPKQHYYVGGNTKVYGAVLFRFRERDFGEVRHVDGVSPAWPIALPGPGALVHPGRAALPGARRTRCRPARAAPATRPYPYPAISHEPRIEQLSADLKAAGLHPFPLPMGIMIDEAAPGQQRRASAARPATASPAWSTRKADAQVVCVEPALRYPNVTLRTDAYVSRLETTRDGRTVTKVVVERDGEREEYSADVVVVSGGRDQHRCPAAAVGQRAPPGRARQRLRRGRPQPDAAQQLVVDRLLARSRTRPSSRRPWG